MNQPVFVGNVKYVFLFMLLSWGGVVIAILRDLCLFSWWFFYGFYHGIPHHESHHHFGEYLLLHFLSSWPSKSKMSRADFSFGGSPNSPGFFLGFLEKKKIERILVTDQNPPLEVGNSPETMLVQRFFWIWAFCPSNVFWKKIQLEEIVVDSPPNTTPEVEQLRPFEKLPGRKPIGKMGWVVFQAHRLLRGPP